LWKNSVQFCYWRNHHHLLHYIYEIYSAKGFDFEEDECNRVPVRLISEDLDLIEAIVTNYYQSSEVCQFYKETDFEFIRKARAIIKNGDAVYFFGDW